MKNYILPTESGGKTLSFSMNFVFNLQELSGKDLITWGKELDQKSELEQGIALCDVAYAAMTAYDQEEGNKIDYNIYKVRKWVGLLDKDQINDFLAALTFNIQPPVDETEGNLKAK